jgi:hypothetical protein
VLAEVVALPAAAGAPLGLDDVELRRELGEQVRAQAVVGARVEGELPHDGAGAGEEDLGHCFRGVDEGER